MKKIPLTKGMFALVDDEDFEGLHKFKWCICGRGKYVYAMTKINGKSILMHRHILGIVEKKMCCDHENGNGLDNRKRNLRICTHAENMRNQRKPFGNRTSIYKGVRFHKRDMIWEARICYNLSRIHLGSFKDEKKAAQAYNEAAKRLFGKFANLNKIK